MAKKKSISTAPSCVTVDFETLGIQGRPIYPPAPVGVSIKLPGMKSHYYAWGHPTDNNCTWAEGRAALAHAYSLGKPLLFQNGKFDVDVAEVHMGLAVPTWDQIHDTLFLIFLDDPNQTELGLKPASERILCLPPEEQDAVADWLIANQPIPGVKISKGKQSPHYFAKYIAYAPGSLVGKYAEGDTERTWKLFEHLYPSIVERGMLEAYDRERRLMPILLEMEREGLPVDLPQLRLDAKLYVETREEIDDWVKKKIKAPADINLNSAAELLEAMDKAGLVDMDLMPRTATGKVSTSKDSLTEGVTDKALLAMLAYRSQLSTCLDTFMLPWLETAEQSGGLIYTSWNQVRSPSGKGNVGTRTGRLSSTPNFQNIPNEFKPLFQHMTDDKEKAKKLPKCPLKLPDLPQMRGYVTAFTNEVLCGRDFSSQELRLLAHFEGGAMQDAYNEKPDLDLHEHAATMISKAINEAFPRKGAKTISFSIIYGSGLGALAEGLDCSVDEAKVLKKAYMDEFPGIKVLQDDLKALARDNEPIHTIGGREYYCEPPKLINGRMQHFEYKLPNTLIQGSAADQTKEATIQLHEKKPKGTRILLLVHDELITSSPKKLVEDTHKAMADAMHNAVALDVPMLSDGEVGANWGSMEPYTIGAK